MTLILSGTNGLSDVDGSASTPAIRGTDSNTGIFFPAADTIAFAEGGAEVARFDSSGNFGLGVTPSAWSGAWKAIQVGSVAAFTASGTTATYGCNWYDDGTAAKYVTNGFAARYTTNNAGQHQWFTSPSGTAGNAISFTQAMTLDSSGNLLVGTTSQGTTERFGVSQSSASSASARFYASSASYTNDIVQISCARSGATTEYNAMTVFDNNTSLKMLIRANGNLLNSNNSYGSLSDAKLKENVSDATPKLEKLNQVRVVNYNLIGETQKQIGVIAQELEPIFPGMVEETPDRDEEGNDLGTTTKSVKYSVFVPMLIKAVQELTAKLDAAEARIAALEGAQA